MIHFIRHSEKLDFVDKNAWEKSERFKENPYDEPLSPNGIKMAQTYLRNVFVTPKKFSFIYSSPLTRCVETSLCFQKYILKKFNTLVPIRIEYGLSEIGHNMTNMNFFRYKNDKIFLINKQLPIDKQLNQKSIYYKYGKKNFDMTYDSIISKETINTNKLEIQQFNTCLKLFKKLIKILNNDTTTILCTSGRVMLLLMSFIKKKLDFDLLRNYFGWCVDISVNIKNNRFVTKKIYHGL